MDRSLFDIVYRKTYIAWRETALGEKRSVISVRARVHSHADRAGFARMGERERETRVRVSGRWCCRGLGEPRRPRRHLSTRTYHHQPPVQPALSELTALEGYAPNSFFFLSQTFSVFSLLHHHHHLHLPMFTIYSRPTIIRAKPHNIDNRKKWKKFVHTCPRWSLGNFIRRKPEACSHFSPEPHSKRALPSKILFPLIFNVCNDKYFVFIDYLVNFQNQPYFSGRFTFRLGKIDRFIIFI